jgi:hypothetical protein
MILVKKRYLFTLTFLFCLLVIFGEIKFFFALKHINQTTNLDVKYEMENFIYASIVLILIVFFFLLNFIRMSNNILKRLDKMIELSAYGKYDVGGHLNQMGRLGERVKYLVFHLDRLNNMKSLKISSLSRMNDFLIQNSGEAVFLMDRYGYVMDCSPKLAEDIGVEKPDIAGKNVNDILEGVHFEDLFSELEKRRKALDKEEITIKAADKTKKCKITFYPIINANEDVSHAMGVVG